MYFTSGIFRRAIIGYYSLLPQHIPYSLIVVTRYGINATLLYMFGIFYFVCMVHAFVLVLLLCYYPGIIAIDTIMLLLLLC